MMDGDHFLAHRNLFDQRTQHFLSFGSAHFFCGFIQAAQEGFHRVAQLNPALVFHRAQIQGLLFFFQRPDFLLHLWRSFS